MQRGGDSPLRSGGDDPKRKKLERRPRAGKRGGCPQIDSKSVPSELRDTCSSWQARRVPGDDHDSEQAAACSEDPNNDFRSSRQLNVQSPAKPGHVRLQAPVTRKHRILAEEFGNAEGYRSPAAATPKQVQFKNEEDQLYATPKKSIAQEQNADAVDKGSTQIIVKPPAFAEPRQDDVSADPKRKNKKRGPSLLGRIMFRKKAEAGCGSS